MSLPALPVSVDALSIAAYLCGMSFVAETMIRAERMNVLASIFLIYLFGFSFGGFVTATIGWLSA